MAEKRYQSPYREIPFGNVPKKKAKKMLKEGTAHGRKLTRKQERALHARASGSAPKRAGRRS